MPSRTPSPSSEGKHESSEHNFTQSFNQTSSSSHAEQNSSYNYTQSSSGGNVSTHHQGNDNNGSAVSSSGFDGRRDEGFLRLNDPDDDKHQSSSNHNAQDGFEDSRSLTKQKSNNEEETSQHSPRGSTSGLSKGSRGHYGGVSSPMRDDHHQSHERESLDEASERTPLIQRDEESTIGSNGDSEPKKKKSSRWPSFVALGLLCVAVILAIVFGFATPAAVEEYAKEAMTFEPTNISIESFTDSGVQVRAQGIFYLDGSKVTKQTVRNLGRAATWIAKEIEIHDAEVDVYLPEYNDTLITLVKIPPITVNIRNGHRNYIDIVSLVEPGNYTSIRVLAQDVMAGKRALDVKAVASVGVKSGIFSLGQKDVTTFMNLHQSGNVTIPDVDVSGLTIAEYGLPGQLQGIVATAKGTILNPYPVNFDLPPLAFEVMLKNCSGQPYTLGVVDVDTIHVLPKQNITADVTGFVAQLPAPLTQVCPKSEQSPLDAFIASYLTGEDTEIYIRGGQQDAEQTPKWIGDLLRDMIVPVPIPSQPLNNSDMIKNFSMSDVHFSLPDFFGDQHPRVSATVSVVIELPEYIDVNVSIDRIRADAEIYYQGNKMGNLASNEWQAVNSSMNGSELSVQCHILDTPIEITDQDVFAEVVRKMIFGNNGVVMEVRASVDISTDSVLGKLVVRKIPAKNEIPISHFGGAGAVKQNVTSIAIVDTSPEELVLQAKVEVENPTSYSAHISHVNISVWVNETKLGYAWTSFDIGPGMNELAVNTSYFAGPVGAEFLSQYISGWNTTITLKTHNESIPGIPDPKLSIDVPVPHMYGSFMKEATMHIWSSTVTFVMFSPLPMVLTSIDASAFYDNKTIGNITYDEPIEIEAGENETPRLPVSWTLAGGWKLIKAALGGTLQLDAHADIGVRMGEWEQQLWYEGHGLGAKIAW